MKNILDETLTAEKPSVEVASWGDPIAGKELDDILSTYKTPYTKTVSDNDEKEEPAKEVVNNSPEINTDDKSDKRFYYQTGKKAGQRKPDHLIQKALGKQPITAKYTPPADGSTLTGSFISGALALTFINLLVPLIICGLNNSFSKVIIDEKLIKLSKEQKKELEPIYDEALKHLEFKGNPVTLAILATLGIMIMNFFMVRSIEKRNLEEKLNKENGGG